MKKLFLSRYFSIAVFFTIVVSAYFINVEVQTHLGKQALAETGLESLPFKEALKKAKTENREILVDVSAIWCTTCRKLDNEVFADTDVKRFISENLIFSRLEYESDEGQNFLAQHETGGFPSLWLLNEDGVLVKRLRVTFDPAEFISQLNR